MTTQKNEQENSCPDYSDNLPSESTRMSLPLIQTAGTGEAQVKVVEAWSGRAIST